MADSENRIGRRALLLGAAAVAAVAAEIAINKRLAPAKAANNARLFLPLDSRFSGLSESAPTATPAVDTDPYIKLLKETNQGVESVVGTNAGFSCTTESRFTLDALYKIDFNDAVKQAMADSIAFDARGLTAQNQGKGYTSAEFFVAGSVQVLPQGMQFSNFKLDLSAYGLSQETYLGQLAVTNKNGTLYLFWVPTNIPFSNTNAMAEINRYLALDFFSVTSSGGDLGADISGRGDYINLVKAQALRIVQH